MCSCSVMSCRGCAAVLADDCANDMQSLSAVDPHFLAIAGPLSEGGSDLGVPQTSVSAASGACEVWAHANVTGNVTGACMHDCCIGGRSAFDLGFDFAVGPSICAQVLFDM